MLVEVALNYQTGVEIMGGKIGLNFSRDKEFPKVALNPDDYYPTLGAKTITLIGEKGGKISYQLTTPLGDGESAVLSANSFGEGGTIDFTLNAPGLAPKTNGVTTGTNTVVGKFIISDSEGFNYAEINADMNVRNNSNVTLGEVVDGKAVFTYDTVFSDNHKGETTGPTDYERRFDYVQKMLNHIIVPLRTPVKESNQENTMNVDGFYGNQNVKVLLALHTGGTVEVGTSQTPKTIELVTGIKISHYKENGPRTFDKLVVDYSGLAETDTSKVIDKEILIGAKVLDTDKHPVNHADVGIYELYENDDWDGDGISNYVEVENSTSFDEKGAITGSVSFDPLKEDVDEGTKKILRSFSRGSVGIRAKYIADIGYQYFKGFGPGNISSTSKKGDYSTVAISSGVRVPDGNKGFYGSSLFHVGSLKSSLPAMR